MTSPARLMAAGMPAGQAQQIGLADASGLTTTGATKAAALVLLAGNNFIATCASAGVAACILPFAEGSPPILIYNGGASSALVFAQAGETINALSTGATFSVTNGKSCIFMPAKKPNLSPPAGAWIANLSA